jgi:hypothetical protein
MCLCVCVRARACVCVFFLVAPLKYVHVQHKTNAACGHYSYNQPTMNNGSDSCAHWKQSKPVFQASGCVLHDIQLQSPELSTSLLLWPYLSLIPSIGACLTNRAWQCTVTRSPETNWLIYNNGFPSRFIMTHDKLVLTRDCISEQFPALLTDNAMSIFTLYCHLLPLCGKLTLHDIAAAMYLYAHI